MFTDRERFYRYANEKRGKMKVCMILKSILPHSKNEKNK
jgi:hypothetical protein